jgi:hypothetical protein
MRAEEPRDSFVEAEIPGCCCCYYWHVVRVIITVGVDYHHPPPKIELALIIRHRLFSVFLDSIPGPSLSVPIVKKVFISSSQATIGL